MIVAIYKGMSLYGLSILGTASGTNTTFVENISLPQDISDLTIRIMVFDNLDNIKPLNHAMTFSSGI